MKLIHNYYGQWQPGCNENDNATVRNMKDICLDEKHDAQTPSEAKTVFELTGQRSFPHRAAAET